MKRILKYLCIAVSVPVALLLLAVVLLYLPPIQRWAVGQATAYIAEQTGMEVGIGNVRLRFPMEISLGEVTVVRPCEEGPSCADTLLNVERMGADIRLLPLLRGRVDVDGLTLEGGRVDTRDLVAAVQIDGVIGNLRLSSHGIDLRSHLATVDEVRMEDSSIRVALADSVPEDTTSTATPWRIDIKRLGIRRSSVDLLMPSTDSLSVKAQVAHLDVADGLLDLGEGAYGIGTLDWQGGSLQYDVLSAPVVAEGLDYNHLLLSDVSLSADSLLYSQNLIRAHIGRISLKEQSGVEIADASGRIQMQGSQLTVSDFRLKTPSSVVSVSTDMDLNAFAENPSGEVNLKGHALLGKQDVDALLSMLPRAVLKAWPDEPMELTANVQGNIKDLQVNQLQVSLPSALTLTSNGTAAYLADEDQRRVDLDFHATTRDLRFALAMLDRQTRRSVRLPYGMSLKGNVRIDGTHYQTATTLRQGKGNARLAGWYDMRRETYDVEMTTSDLPLQHFLPLLDISPLTVAIQAKGRGTDFFSAKTTLEAKADVDSLWIAGYGVSGLTATATMGDKNLHVDLQGLEVTDSLRSMSVDGHADLAFLQKDTYELQAVLNHLRLNDGTSDYKADDINVGLSVLPSRTSATIQTGDLAAHAEAEAGYAQLMAQVDTLTAEVQRQWQTRRIDQVRLRERMPDVRLQAHAGRRNVVSQILAQEGYGLSSLQADLSASPVEGLDGYLRMDTLVVAGVQLDKINLQLDSESDIINYYIDVQNGKKNPQYTFRAHVGGNLNESGSAIAAQVYDEREELGVDVGLVALLEPDGVRIRLADTNPLLGFMRFKANADNYVLLADDGRVEADLLLKAEDGTGVQIYSDDNEEALQDITVALNRLDLGRVFSAIPYMPAVSGLMNGDFHLVQTEDQLSVSSNLSVEGLAYEQSPIGNIGTELVYIPKADGSHFVDGLLLKDDEEIGTLSGTYRSEDGFDAALTLKRMPLNIVNGFIPDRIIGLRGFAEGDLAITGAGSTLQINGEVFLSESALYSDPYGLSMRFADDPVRIEDSRLVFENFELYSNNDSPLNVSGYYDFSNLSRMNMNIRMRADNFLLVDAKENPRSEAFGKAYVNFFGTMSGPVDHLSMLGKLDVLGTTDLSYILRDSELSNDTQLDELVKFVDFQDTTTVISVQRPPINGFSMDLAVNVDEAAHLFCALNTDKSNYLDINGGGELRLRYLPTGDISLTGRYTLDNGKMKYSLPVIPLKTFNIAQGSYLEFTGDVMNPTLHITATENVKANVNEGDGAGRSVDFVCGVSLSQTLNNLGLSFVIEAPNDNFVRDELNTMSAEERGKVAITMLASGMYLADGNTNGFTMNSALSAFLQSEINNIAGSAMQSLGLGLSMGIDNTTNATGGMQTDYNFQFSKRLWSNRLSFIVGGKVSTGSDPAMRDESIFDNVELEYRLNKNASQYLRLFYDNNTFDWLEGMIGQYGAGFMWRRKLQHFRDIFRLKSDSPSAPPAVPQPADTTKNERKPTHEE